MTDTDPPDSPPELADTLPPTPDEQPGILYLMRFTEARLRELAVDLVSVYVPSVIGDPRFEEVTQGRAHDLRYSSCGDLCHWLLWRIGCREQGFVNREEPEAGYKWKSEVNVSYLGPYGKAPRLECWTPYTLGSVPRPGDSVLIGDQRKGEIEHVFVFREAIKDTWHSFDFGQMNDKLKPCSKTITRTLRGDKLDGRTVLGWVNLGAVPLTEAANLAR